MQLLGHDINYKTYTHQGRVWHVDDVWLPKKLVYSVGPTGGSEEMEVGPDLNPNHWVYQHVGPIWINQLDEGAMAYIVWNSKTWNKNNKKVRGLYFAQIDGSLIRLPMSSDNPTKGSLWPHVRSPYEIRRSLSEIRSGVAEMETNFLIAAGEGKGIASYLREVPQDFVLPIPHLALSYQANPLDLKRMEAKLDKQLKQKNSVATLYNENAWPGKLAEAVPAFEELKVGGVLIMSLNQAIVLWVNNQGESRGWEEVLDVNEVRTIPRYLTTDGHTILTAEFHPVRAPKRNDLEENIKYLNRARMTQKVLDF